MADTSLLISSESRYAKYMIASFSSWFGSLALGTVVGYTANAIPSVQSEGSHVKLSTNQISWLGSLMALGAVLGSICAGSLIEYIGRKGTLIMTSIPFVFGWLLMAYAGRMESPSAILIGRFITGYCCGLISLTAPVYIAETADPSKRGFLGSGFQLSICVGVLISFIAGKYVSWAYLCIISSIFPIIMLIMMCLMPETPYWLIKRGRISEATEANIFLHGLDSSQQMNAEVSINTVSTDGTTTEENKSSVFLEFKRRHVIKPFLLVLALMFFQQSSGVNALIFYTTYIFKSSGSHSLDASDATILVGAVQVVAAFAACLLTDRAGRKPLILLSSVGCGLSLLLLSIYHFLCDAKGSEFQKLYGWIPVVALITFMVAFSLGLGPIPWLLMSELLPANVKSVASGLCSSYNWLFAFIITKLFHTLIDTLLESGTYLLFSILCFCCTVFVALLLPETKGKSLTEIENIFRDRTTTTIN
ncbi:facilitated trehalose transporter Tret1-like [Oppia nitens]|uniref:facilitated trehalose transporter Tret1-like n=1 Tax=Oppia nitens TaxID=1686743 RepID=UPI0023DC4327|nr:facilitated trehalose transporter Tret1-like [Oppia nitens]